MNENYLMTRFRRNGSLVREKLMEYLPALIVTNMSTFLLLSIDGLVVGNLIGADALAAVNIFYPASVFIGALTAILSNGASSALSTCLGRNDIERIRSLKKAIFHLMIIGTVVISLVQIPLVYLLIHLYKLTPEMNSLTWLYALGILISSPFGVISTVGTFMLQILGKSKSLMWLTAAEGVANVVFDLLFIAVFHMGVIGASMGTACACAIRCMLTMVYIIRKTDLLKFGDATILKSDVKDILTSGLPEASNMGILALQNYFMMYILVVAFGSNGGVIKGVVTFCYNIVFIFISGVQGAARPLSGLMSGSDDRTGHRHLMRQSNLLMIVGSLALTGVIELFPPLFYRFNGIIVIPKDGILSLRLGALYFVFNGINALFRLYFTNRKDKHFAVALTWLGNATMPLFAWILMKTAPTPFIWLSYTLSNLLITVISLLRYWQWVIKDSKLDNPSDKRICLSVEPDGAIEASHLVQQIGKDGGFPARLVYRVTLCVEEMVAYGVATQKKKNVNNHIDILLTNDEARFTILDDGERVELHDDWDINQLVIDNYNLMQKVAATIDYQYILDMNFFVLTFREKKA